MYFTTRAFVDSDHAGHMVVICSMIQVTDVWYPFCRVYCYFVLEDNQLVLVNSSKPHFGLKKKSSSIALLHYFLCGGVSKDECWCVTYLNMYLLTKIVDTRTNW